MTLAAEKFTIRLPRPFRIAHGASATRDTLLVHLHENGFTGHGEGALPPYYPSTAEAGLDWLKSCDPACAPPPSPPEAAAARTAWEVAIHDLRAQQAGLPLWKYWGLDPAEIPPCPTTLSIPESEGELRESLAEALADGAPILKLKSASGDSGWDEYCAGLVAAAGRPFSVDANAGWSAREASRIIPRLQELGVEFVEQPVGREPAAWQELRGLLAGRSAPLLVADESLQSENDLPVLATVADGVNVKILKAGGLTTALRWIARARSLRLRVMVGVMVETGIGRTAAAHLASLADWLDIDPPSRIPAAPLCGFSVTSGRLALSGLPGLGLEQVP
jgi:L-alanine-DL-glutamate epimerase-like enolase superfamily enzyme